jgi:hypothetical protein
MVIKYAVMSAPIPYAITVGTVSTQILPAGGAISRQLFFYNPSASASVAICPTPDNNGNALAAVLNGAGSFTLGPGQYIYVGMKTNVASALNASSSAWNAIASASSSPLTVWETDMPIAIGNVPW